MGHQHSKFLKLMMLLTNLKPHELELMSNSSKLHIVIEGPTDQFEGTVSTKRKMENRLCTGTVEITISVEISVKSYVCPD